MGHPGLSWNLFLKITRKDVQHQNNSKPIKTGQRDWIDTYKSINTNEQNYLNYLFNMFNYKSHTNQSYMENLTCVWYYDEKATGYNRKRKTHMIMLGMWITRSTVKINLKIQTEIWQQNYNMIHLCQFLVSMQRNLYSMWLSICRCLKTKVSIQYRNFLICVHLKTIHNSQVIEWAKHLSIDDS